MNSQEDRRPLGRSAGDSERLFPRFSNAQAAATSEVEVNGKVLKIWEYSQLEALSNPILHQRVIAIRDALGEANCPKMPAAQAHDRVRWILQMQSQITDQRHSVGVPKPGRDGVVPSAFWQDTKATNSQVPFGPRVQPADYAAKRDSYRDIKEHRNEYADPECHMRQGIESMRPGGEGRRHIQPSTNMLNSGMGSEHPHPGGRRFLGCKDHMGEYLRDAEVEPPRDEPAGAPSHRSPRSGGYPRGSAPAKHVSHSSMASPGVSAPKEEPHIGGERRKHANVPSRMIAHGVSNHEEDPSAPGRRHLDCFAGSKKTYSDAHEQYRPNWKKDPSRLQGSSLLI